MNKISEKQLKRVYTFTLRNGQTVKVEAKNLSAAIEKKSIWLEDIEAVHCYCLSERVYDAMPFVIGMKKREAGN